MACDDITRPSRVNSALATARIWIQDVTSILFQKSGREPCRDELQFHRGDALRVEHWRRKTAEENCMIRTIRSDGSILLHFRLRQMILEWRDYDYAVTRALSKHRELKPEKQTWLLAVVHTATIVELDDDFKKNLRASYQQDSARKKIYDMVSGRTPPGTEFCVASGLLYLIDGNRDRLCIL